jgi:adenosylcobinamide-phosphate synthase
VSRAFYLSTPAIFAAFVLDIFLGETTLLPHPVVLIGWSVRWGERLLRRSDGRQNLWRGAILTIFITSFTAAVTCLIVAAFGLIVWWLAAAAGILIAWTTIAGRSLDEAALAVESKLAANDLPGARNAMPALVGRDPQSMDCEQMIRATLESLAESASDGVVAPLLWLFVAGPAGAIAYKAINTLDSMIGYRDDRYIYFGRVAAKLDDTANFIPARITAACIAGASAILNGRGRNALSTCFRDASSHASPNAGWPESAIAGALGVQLGGAAVYEGELEARALLGDDERAVQIDDVRVARQIVRFSAILALIASAMFRYLVIWV